jgi:hypothetical protein
VRIRIYVEGGGDHRNTFKACRSGFAQFFAKLALPGVRPKVIPAGSRKAAFDDFCTALTAHMGEFILLLVDSEEAVVHGTQPWAHLRVRDGWDRPNGATDEQAHLMVQCMEAWFLADKEALTEYYGQGFLVNSLPGQANVEIIRKRDVVNALDHASRNTQKETYHKTRHGFDLLGRIDPAKVRRASAHADRLFEALNRAVNP